MSLLSIRIYPDPFLRKVCSPVTSFDAELARLASDMVETMHAAPGVGLAASQVGVDLRIAVVDLSVGEEPEQLFTMVNPEISGEGGSAVEVEGCLSIPGISDKVVRPERFTLRAQDVQGNAFELEAEDWLARAIAHEVDHLNGVLFVDHLTGLRRDRARRRLRRLAAKGESQEWERADVSV
ncbi:MAG TPA: peptide deformylase [Thermoanaerobaculia bacterium]|nr:peptide deformylase [Thermoanaerobaculia bacterium]